MSMKSAIVEGERVSIGEFVGFKSDIEQTGKIIAIKSDLSGRAILTLEDEDGFSGDYIGGQNITTELAVDCWLD